MTGKKAALLAAALVTAFVSGYYTAAFQFKKLSPSTQNGYPQLQDLAMLRLWEKKLSYW